MALLDNVRTQAREIQYRRLVVSVLLFPSYVVGWLLGKGAIVLSYMLYATGWLAGQASIGGRYALAAVKVGWQDARERSPDKGGK